VGEKTRVVLDTNVWVSIFFNKVLGEEFEELLESGRIEVFVSEDILKEVARVLEYPKIKRVLESAGVTSRDVLEEILRVSSVVNPKEKLDVVAEDPDDDKFLECAVECGAEYLVSGDKHLLKVGEYRGIKVVPAREFLKMF